MFSHGEDRSEAGTRTVSPNDLLGSWKEIAAYLQRDVRTVMRWEMSRRLPVHRLPGGPKAAVYALKSELEAWRAARPAAPDTVTDGLLAIEPAVGQPARVPGSRSLLILAAAIVLVVVAALVLRRGWSTQSAGVAPIRSLAVLPFENLNKDPAQDYFAEGMHETLLTDLARGSGVPVISHTSVEQYRGGRVPARQIARELHVDAVVEGSVLRVRDRVRITAQLVRGDTEEHVWANTYDYDVSDVLALIARVSDAITSEIQKAVAGSRTPEQSSAPPQAVRAEVLDSYLRARFAFHSLTPEGLENALALHRKAIELDSSFAPAWNGVAGTRTAQAFFGFVPPAEALPEAREAARRALSLDDRQGDAYGTLGYIALYWDWNFDSARTELERAVALSPNNLGVRHEYADYLLATGKVEESLAQVRLGHAGDPSSLLARSILLYHCLMARRYQDVVTDGATMIETAPTGPAIHDYVGRALWLQGRHTEALAHWRTAFRIDREGFRAVEGAYALGGAHAVMLELARRAAAEANASPSGAVHVASLFAAAGDADHAFEWLDHAYRRREPFLLHVVADPFFDPIRADHRMPVLLRRIGINP